jgi:hypothetical protein
MVHRDMPLPRLQLFEFNDLASVPAPLRDTIVESLSRALRWGRMLEGLVPPLRQFLREAGATEVLDLCAGAAGPAEILAEELERAGDTSTRIVLTDLFPRLEAWEAARAAHPGVIDMVAEPVDATAIPRELADGRVRTVINAFHHFPPALAEAILRDAVASSRGIFVSEAFGRNPLGFLPFAPAGLASLLAAPLFTGRDRAAKALLTWFSPIAFLAGTWDGLVSTMRIYDEDDIRRMVASFGGHWRWEFGTYAFRPGGRGHWFYGVPAAS